MSPSHLRQLISLYKSVIRNRNNAVNFVVPLKYNDKYSEKHYFFDNYLIY
jgi:hypothetical protein